MKDGGEVSVGVLSAFSQQTTFNFNNNSYAYVFHGFLLKNNA